MEVVGDGRPKPRAVRLLRAILERTCELQVQLGAFARQQIVVDDLAKQGVAKCEAVVVGADEVQGECVTKPIADLSGVETTGRDQEAVVCPARHREDGEDPPRVRRQLLDACEQRLAERGRE
jgi:hypothetical protein